jgi:hypothetical protein
MARQTGILVYHTQDRLEASWFIDYALHAIQWMDCSGIDPKLLDRIVKALESAERVLSAIE